MGTLRCTGPVCPMCQLFGNQKTRQVGPLPIWKDDRAIQVGRFVFWFSPKIRISQDKTWRKAWR